MITFMHNPCGSGRVTIAIDHVGDSAKAAVAFCSPKDRFARERGRRISSARLAREASQYCFQVKIEEGAKLKQKIFDEFSRFLHSSPRTPSWAKIG